MSTRRFSAYFFAIAAGSTFAFASTLWGQPAPQGASTQEVAAQEAAKQRAEMLSSSTAVGLNVMPLEIAPRLHQRRSHHASAAPMK